MDYVSIDPDKFEDNIDDLKAAAEDVASKSIKPDDTDTKEFTASENFHTAYTYSQKLNTKINTSMTSLGSDLSSFKDVIIEINEDAEATAEG